MSVKHIGTHFAGRVRVNIEFGNKIMAIGKHEDFFLLFFLLGFQLQIRMQF